MELESDMDNLNLGISKVSLGDGVVGNGLAHFSLTNGVGTVAGEHPYGEHPSRTLFVRNINSNVEDSELRALFEVVNSTTILLNLLILLFLIFNYGNNEKKSSFVCSRQESRKLLSRVDFVSYFSSFVDYLRHGILFIL
ncbi:putative nucleotide-binding alpha-beta plait domain superfamily, RNA-binding domain superfamily [Helianthus annuus]|nr:putative nucleotide-binding alpha-beta plait domain superfamily, RNA-binding domain superfamily [Helianthus annuus]